MLRELVKTIAAGKAHSPTELARQLDVSEGLVEQMMDELEHKGYLEQLLSASCAGGCSACAIGKTCSTQQPMRSWVLTEKGLRMVERQPAT